MSAAIYSFVAAVVVVISLLHGACALPLSMISPAVRQTSKHDVVGHYKLQTAWTNVFSQAKCASEISIGTFWHDVSRAPSNFPAPEQFNIQIPHASITLDGKTCGSAGMVLAVESGHPFVTKADNKALIVDTFCRGGHRRPSTVSRLCSEGMVKTLERHSFVFGYDWDLLSCSGTTISPDHSFMFIQPQWNVIITEKPKRTVLAGGKKYLLMTRKNFGGACVYELFKDRGNGPITDPSLRNKNIWVDTNKSVISPRPTEERDEGVPVVSPSPLPRGTSTVEESETVTIGENGIPELRQPIESRTRRDCFPASAQLTLPDGTKQAMEHLSVGARILVNDNNGVTNARAVHSSIYAFTHKDHSALSEYVRITTADGNSITLSPGHYIYVHDKGGNTLLMTARTVRADGTHSLETQSGAKARVASVERVVQRGLFAPHTMHGDLIVDSIRVSSYTEALHPTTAHRLMAPLRLLHSMRLTLPGVHHIAQALAKFAPGAPETIIISVAAPDATRRTRIA